MRKLCVLFAVAVFALLGCNKEKSGQTATPSTSTAAPSTPDYIVGVQAPITGKYASEGQGMVNAVRLLADQQNAEGGLNGATVKVVPCDDEGTAQKAVICAQTLIDAGVKVVIGSYTTGATAASQPTYAKANVIQTSDATGAILTKEKYPTYFRASFNDDIEGVFTADYFVNTRNYKRIVVISDYGAFSDGLARAVVNNLNKLGVPPVANEKITEGQQDYSAVLTKIKNANPDVIYFSGYYTESGLLRKQQKQQGIKADYYGGNATDNPEFIKIAGLENAAGSYLIGLPTPDQLADYYGYPEAKKFRLDYMERYKEPIPSIWTVINTDGLRVVFEAAKQVKNNDSVVVAKYIRGSISNFNGLSGPISIQEDGERAGSIYVPNIINAKGEYEIWKKPVM